MICARFGQSAVAVDHEVWNAVAQFGRGTCVSGVAAVGFPIPRLRVVRSSRPMAGRSSWPGASGVGGRLVPTRPERLAVAADGGL